MIIMAEQKIPLDITCPKCNSRCVRSGFALWKGGKKARAQCTKCGHPFCYGDVIKNDIN